MELSFSKKARLEAIENFKISKSSCCNANFINGFFIDDKISDDTQEIIIQSDLLKSLKIVKKVLSLFEIDSYIVSKEKQDKKSIYLLYITDKKCVERLSALHIKNDDCQRCGQYFLYGVFISKAVIVNPEKEYQLEFVFKDKNTAEFFIDFLYELGFAFKTIKRKKSYVVYTKNSETIEDILATTGAQSMCLEIMSGKVVKDIRNRVNRLTNCETANIAKSSQASSRHLAAIYKLIETEKLDLLSDDLRELAQLKIDNPELSLAELGAIASPVMTKSSVNRRMQKLCQLAFLEEK